MGEDKNEKERIIQEYVPGKQVTLCHVIASPDTGMCEKLGIEKKGAIGIMTITPGEGAIIAADIAVKAAEVELVYIDRFSGSLVFTGDVAAVEDSLKAANDFLTRVLGFAPAPLTRT
ncbi:MAG: ethanolamine utilization microcompartment protein EutS [Thermacetogeniaceae bacterium]